MRDCLPPPLQTGPQGTPRETYREWGNGKAAREGEGNADREGRPQIPGDRKRNRPATDRGRAAACAAARLPRSPQQPIAAPYLARARRRKTGGNPSSFLSGTLPHSLRASPMCGVWEVRPGEEFITAKGTTRSPVAALQLQGLSVLLATRAHVERARIWHRHEGGLHDIKAFRGGGREKGRLERGREELRLLLRLLACPKEYFQLNKPGLHPPASQPAKQREARADRRQ